jgi:hypothetical protein
MPRPMLAIPPRPCVLRVRLGIIVQPLSLRQDRHRHYPIPRRHEWNRFSHRIRRLGLSPFGNPAIHRAWNPF